MSQNLKVTIDERLGAEKAIRRFKRMCDNLGVVKEYRMRQEYKKPSVRTKEKNEAAEKRRRKTSGRDSKFGSKL